MAHGHILYHLEIHATLMQYIHVNELYSLIGRQFCVRP